MKGAFVKQFTSISITCALVACFLSLSVDAAESTKSMQLPATNPPTVQTTGSALKKSPAGKQAPSGRATVIPGKDANKKAPVAASPQKFPGLIKPPSPSGSGLAIGDGGVMAAKLAPPVVEIKEFSGDFTKWSKSIVVYGTDTTGNYMDLQFRWSINNNLVKSARYVLKQGGLTAPFGNAQTKKTVQLGQVASQNKQPMFTVRLFDQKPQYSGKFYVQVIPFDGNGKQLSDPSKPVEITYHPKQSNITQKIMLDSLEILNVMPASGTVKGLEKNKTLTKDTSIEVLFKYDLITVDAARILPNFVLENGETTYSVYKQHKVEVKKEFNSQLGKVTGLGNRLIDLAFPCSQHSGNVKIKQINYVLKSGANVIAKGNKALPVGITFQCPGETKYTQLKNTIGLKKLSKIQFQYVQIQHLSPSNGPVNGPSVNEALNAGNSVEIFYNYKLESEPEAAIRHFPIFQNNTLGPTTSAKAPLVSNGSGTIRDRFTVRCKSSNQPASSVKGLNIRLVTHDNKTLYEKVVPVNYLFTCN